MPHSATRLVTLVFTMMASLLVQADNVQPAQSPADKTRLFCGDKAGWPPYTFVKDGVTQGYDLDVLEAILTPKGIRYQVMMLPWRRCLEMVRNGHIDVALSASGNRHRKQLFRMTRPYYSVTPSYVYPAERFPEGVTLTSAEAVRRYKVCGLRGYSYHSFGLTGERIEQTTNTFPQLFSKVEAGHCDLLLARYEVLQGFSRISAPMMSGDWRHSPLPETPKDNFHMLVSRNISDGDDLMQLLNRGISELEASGKLKELLAPYVKQDAEN